MEHIAVKLNLSSIEYVCFMKLNQNVLLPPPPPTIVDNTADIASNITESKIFCLLSFAF